MTRFIRRTTIPASPIRCGRTPPAATSSRSGICLLTHHVQDALFETPGLSPKERRRAAFWWRNWLNAVAPTNFFWTNPVAMHKFVETQGDSLARGMHNFLADARAGNVRLTNPDDFKVGENLATTPGAVVYPQPDPGGDPLHADDRKRSMPTPIVIVTPWINKFYILDLEPEEEPDQVPARSGLQRLHHQLEEPGRRDARRQLRRLPHRRRGSHRRRSHASICKSDKVHAIGYCIGGTALAMYMAWVNRKLGDAGEGARRPLDACSPRWWISAIRAISRCSSTTAACDYLSPHHADPRLPRRQGDGCCVPAAALQQPDLAVRGEWLPVRRISAALRCPVLEHGHHAHALRACTTGTCGSFI
ncbi:MAG: hypothetical protein MZW92_51610 [Comamonadaceae bacterium]|nr:hypothetical protein [Comamonadaceae bacterium]